jgi:hypothetical protein
VAFVAPCGAWCLTRQVEESRREIFLARHPGEGRDPAWKALEDRVAAFAGMTSKAKIISLSWDTR